MEKIIQVTEQKEHWLPLLLEADPSEEMIRGYLDRGELYLLQDGQQAVAAAVLVALGDGKCELKNIAVPEEKRGQGYGSRLLRALLRMQRGKSEEMLVGTTAPTEPFYLSLGFSYSHSVPNFFIDHYREPIFEGNVRCVDMRYLKIPVDG